MGVAAVPAVGDYEDDGLSAEGAAEPLVVEGFDGVADAGAAGPVGDGAGYFGDGVVDAAVLELAGDAGQAGGEQEGFDGGAGGG